MDSCRFCALGTYAPFDATTWRHTRLTGDLTFPNPKRCSKKLILPCRQGFTNSVESAKRQVKTDSG